MISLIALRGACELRMQPNTGPEFLWEPVRTRTIEGEWAARGEHTTSTCYAASMHLNSYLLLILFLFTDKLGDGLT
jgi:hypothetical protein